jgi:mannose-1-phosphate guanylyltransferase/mannose-6-phosphate isomerase
MATSFFPVILAGGSGTRLWPLSRKNFPKQFLCLDNQKSLLQQTVERISHLPCMQAIIVSNDDHYFLCQEQLTSSTISFTYLLEPCARNTAPAIASAAHHLVNTVGRDAIMLILPADHWIPDHKKWCQIMHQGARIASDHRLIVTFGIKPTSAKTGYGYIEAGELLLTDTYTITSFHEKPDEITAKEFVNAKNFFWNSGMFICQAGVYLDELQRLASDIAIDTDKALQLAYRQHDFIRLDAEFFAKCRSESIDYAIMEHTNLSAVVPINISWSDLGCWQSVAEINTVDSQGNSVSGKVITKDSYNCLIKSEQLLVTTLGITDQIIIATADAILIADKSYSQSVKELVKQVSTHLRVNRPWGYYEVLAEGEFFKVKRLMVKPGAKLSLQKHQHRAEHWVVVGGQADIINGEINMVLCVNQSTYIPQKTCHRLANSGIEPLYIIEVQSGSYLGEDDIERFDDIYQRKVANSIV